MTMSVDASPAALVPNNRRSGVRTPFTAVVRGVSKAVVPHQLKVELGGHDVWTAMGAVEGTTVVLANVPQAVLEAAVLAHAADPFFDRPDLKLVADKAETDPAFAALARLMGVLPQTKGA